MERAIAIVTPDAVYGHTLCEYMTGAHVLNYRIIPFYDALSYIEYRTAHSVAVLLIDEEIKGEVDRECEENIITLSETRKDMSDTIFKYQALDVIVKELNYLLHRRKGAKGEKDSKFKTIAVTSSKGGTGVTSFSIVLATVESKENSTLYISFDPTSCLPEGQVTDNHSLSELIYNLKLYGAHWTDYADGIIRHNKDFDYITGVLCFEDVLAFGRAEARDFFAGLSKFGRYDVVVIDSGMKTGGSYVFFEKCEKLYMVGDSNLYETKNYIEQLKRLIGDEVVKKISLVELPFDEAFSGDRDLDEYEDTKMYAYVKELLGGKEATKELTEIAVGAADTPKKSGKEENQKSVIRRLMEKGFSEGFNG